MMVNYDCFLCFLCFIELVGGGFYALNSQKFSYLQYFVMDRSAHRDQDDSRVEEKHRKGREQFKCGEAKCSKYYHSYTAFYNHCKKAHNGEFPPSSLLNGDNFDGPTKNRGRPRIKKSEVKNEFQIESMKAENELIEFLGTIKNTNSGKNQELISYVEDPAERMEEAISIVREWIKDDKVTQYFSSLSKFNDIICKNDLPEFYDPIEYEQYKDRVDSYNFNSISKFFRQKKQTLELAEPIDNQILLLCWLCRILSLKLLAETIYILLQKNLRVQMNERDFFIDKSNKFLELVSNYLELIDGESIEQNGE